MEELQQQEQLKKALFGALYTLAKEKINDTARIAYFSIFVDFILICCLFLMPEYPWAIDVNSPCVGAPWLRGVAYLLCMRGRTRPLGVNAAHLAAHRGTATHSSTTAQRCSPVLQHASR